MFHQSGRVHRRGSTLTGFMALVLGPAGMSVPGERDGVPLDGEWSGYELVSVDLRDRRRLEVKLPDAPPVVVDVDSEVHLRLVGDPVDGVSSVDGTPVFGEQVWLSYDGYLADAGSG